MDRLFRSLFGFPDRKDNHSRSPDDRGHPFGDPFPSEREGQEGRPGFFPFDDEEDRFTFQHPDMDIFQHLDQMFAHFDDVFKSFGIMDLPSIEPRHGEVRIFPALPPGSDHKSSPRDEMLKQPDDSPSVDSWSDSPSGSAPGLFGRLWTPRRWDQMREPKTDADLDDSVRSGGLDTLFDTRRREVSPSQPSRGTAFRSVSVQTHRGPDGRVEERRVMVDGNGNEQTVVTRSFGGQTIKQTTKRDKNGQQEVIEDLINMDEKDKQIFEDKWNAPQRFQGTPQFDVSPWRGGVRQEPDVDSSYQSIFSKLFGPRKD